MTIAAILRHKGNEVVSMAAAASVAAVAHELTSRRIGAVVVLGETGQLLGILSERDIVHVVSRHGASALTMTAAQVMTRPVRTIAPPTSIEQAMEMMTEGRFRHLPVVEEGRIVGIVSIGDVVKAQIMQQKVEVDSLRAYVTGAA